MYHLIEQKMNQLDTALKKLAQNGREYAECERDYKIELTKQVLKLRNEGQSVTLIPLVAYGIKEVADLRFKRDVAEAMYKSAQEFINNTKLELRIMQDQYSREWNNAK